MLGIPEAMPGNSIGPDMVILPLPPDIGKGLDPSEQLSGR